MASHPPPHPPPPLLVPPQEEALVVRLKVLDTQPIVMVVFDTVEYDPAEVALSTTVLPELMSPETEVKGAPSRLYCPPTMDREVRPVIPVIVTVLEVYWVERFTPVIPGKLNASGTVSAGSATAKRES